MLRGLAALGELGGGVAPLLGLLLGHVLVHLGGGKQRLALLPLAGNVGICDHTLGVMSAGRPRHCTNSARLGVLLGRPCPPWQGGW